jgi:hypothetical protein
MSRFDAVQTATRTRNAPDSQALARQIVAAADGDMRVAYDFLDTLNRHVTRMLQERGQ